MEWNNSSGELLLKLTRQTKKETTLFVGRQSFPPEYLTQSQSRTMESSAKMVSLPVLMVRPAVNSLVAPTVAARCLMPFVVATKFTAAHLALNVMWKKGNVKRV